MQSKVSSSSFLILLLPRVETLLIKVHLLYRKQGGDKPRNMFALQKWAFVVLSSPIARELMSKESDGEYLRELQQIAQINKIV